MKRFISSLGFSIVAALATILVAGCHESGTWKDDAANWKRIFRVGKPGNVRVVHSWYWRSPHFTYEFEYYIQIEKNADLQKRLLTMNSMKQINEKRLKAAAERLQNRPAWFVPKPIAEYEVWVYSHEPDNNFHLLIDRKSGDLFLEDRLL